MDFCCNPDVISHPFPSLSYLFAQALEGLGQVSSMQPDHAEVPKALARLYYKTGKHDLAVQVMASCQLCCSSLILSTYVCSV